MANKRSAFLTPVACLTILASTIAFSGDASEQASLLFESSFSQESTGNLDLALSDVLKVLELDPAHYIANYRAAWLYYLKGRYEESIAHYEKAAALATGALEPRLALMLPLMAANKWEASEALGKEILEQVPNNYLAGSRLAFIYFSRGKYKKAAQTYETVWKNFPSEIEMILGLGWTYLKQGRKEEARTMFEKVLAIRRHNLSALSGLEQLSLDISG